MRLFLPNNQPGITRRKAVHMKKFLSFFLALMMIITIIPIGTLTVSAASDNNGWEEVFSSRDTYGNTIQILQNNVKKGIQYTSQVKFVINGNDAYVTSKYTRCFSAYTLKDICKLDKKLKKEDIWGQIETIQSNQISHEIVIELMDNFSARQMNQWSSKQLKNKIQAIAKDCRKDVLNKFALEKLGMDTPSAFEMTTSVLGYIENIQGIGIFVMDVLYIWTYQAKKALGTAESVEMAETQYSSDIASDTYWLCRNIRNLK